MQKDESRESDSLDKVQESPADPEASVSAVRAEEGRAVLEDAFLCVVCHGESVSLACTSVQARSQCLSRVGDHQGEGEFRGVYIFEINCWCPTRNVARELANCSRRPEIAHGLHAPTRSDPCAIGYRTTPHLAVDSSVHTLLTW
jgi:hypothetical protein